MTLPLRSSLLVRLQVLALLVAITGMVVQIAAGVPFPKVPPGIVILATVCVLVAVWSEPWVRLLCAVVPGLILIAGVISPTGRTNISNLGAVGVFWGTLLQFAGLAVACVAGLAHFAESRTSRRRVDAP